MALSFSAAAKAEICRELPAKSCCALAECFGILLYSNSFQSSGIKIITESRDFAVLLPKLFKRAFDLTFDGYPSLAAPGKLTFQIWEREKVAAISQPFGSINDRIRMTEQGEIIQNKYGNQDTAYYNLEMLASATIDRIVSKQIVSEDDIGGFRSSMDEIVLDSNKVYRKLVFETPAFLDYFLQATPIKQISNLNIGSRPAARKKITDFSGLRAIPWVFSWSQSRIMFPGWYGVGSAFKHFIDANPNNLHTLQKMYQGWPFFHSLLSNVDMVLSKSNMDIAKQYADLCEDEDTKKVFDTIYQEWKLTKEVILQIEGNKELLADNPSLKMSLNYRMPYFNILNYIQIEMIKRDRVDEIAGVYESILPITINGVTSGLRNSG